MALPSEKRVETDILVVGGGGAGCFAAIKAHDAGCRVLLVNKVPWLGGCTMIARAGYSAALGTIDPRDNPDLHLRDSVKGGGYVGNQKVLKTMCRGNVEATLDLLEWGAAFRKKPDGKLDLGVKARAGHSYPRFVSVPGGFSHIGKTIMDALRPQVEKRAIEAVGNIMVTNLLHSAGKITGAVGFNWRDGTLMVFNAKSVILATGGTGHLYKYTDNPSFITGDGYAVSSRAGAELVDMEFCDFQLGIYHPRQLFGYPPNCALWMTHGAILLNRKGERFFKKHFPQRKNEDEGLRTEISRAVAWEILDGNGSPEGMAYLNCSNVPTDWMMTARGEMVSTFKRAGIDLAWQPLQIAPGNHTYLGGLRIDERTESTKIEGLFAAGEAAGGWGGSNRLGGNGVASALGLGVAAGKFAAERSKTVSMPKIDEQQITAERKKIEAILDRKEGIGPQKIMKQVQELMQKHLWLRRSAEGLTTTLEELQMLNDQLPRLYVPGGRKIQRYLGLRHAMEAINLLECGQIVATAALERKESRGSHQRSDFPNTDNQNWLKNIIIWQENGRRHVAAEPVVPAEVPLPKI